MQSGVGRFSARSILVNQVSEACLVSGCLVIASCGSPSGLVRLFSGGAFRRLTDDACRKRNPSRVAVVNRIKVSRAGHHFFMSSRNGLGVFTCSLSDILAAPRCRPDMGVSVGGGLFPSSCLCLGSALYVTGVVRPVNGGSCGPSITE